MEDGEHKPEYSEAYQSTWKQPYIMRLILTAAMGGLLLGYDTGFIYGAILEVQDRDFPSGDSEIWFEEIISTAITGAILGAVLGGWINDRFGRRSSILIADRIFFYGTLITATAPFRMVMFLGRIIMGFGMGMVSVASPLYISEASPARIRGALVSTFGLLIAVGQFLFYLVNLAFTKGPETWRWLVGVGGVSALFQYVLMFPLPDSPRWLYRKNKKEEAMDILRKIYPPHEVDKEVKALQSSVEDEIAKEGSIGGGDFFTEIRKATSDDACKGITKGCCCHLAQQFLSVKEVIYSSPAIVEIAGFSSNKVALALPLIVSGLSVVGSIVSITFVDRIGRRMMMFLSMNGTIFWIWVLFAVFSQAVTHSPVVGRVESIHFGINSTCSSYLTAPNASSWSCINCLQEFPDCGFCANGVYKYYPGACVASNPSVRSACHSEHRGWYSNRCPSRYGWLALVGLGGHFFSFSTGMGTIPWILNSEMYPLRYRGICGGIAAVFYWSIHFFVSFLFLGPASLDVRIRGIGFFSLIGFVGINFIVLETKGLPFEDVAEMLERDIEPQSVLWGDVIKRLAFKRRPWKWTWNHVKKMLSFKSQLSEVVCTMNKCQNHARLLLITIIDFIATSRVPLPLDLTLICFVCLVIPFMALRS